MSIIEISNLRKKYDTVTALEDLSLSVKQGEIYGLLGPNGSGKSTTMRCLLSLVKPTSGSIKLFDKELHKNRRAVLSKIGYLIEKPDFYGYLSAKRNLQLLAAYCDKPISELRIDEVLEQVGLKGREKDLVKTYSHGMKQRLGLAQVIMHQPELVILDEPNTGLDPSGIIDLRVFIQQLKAEGKTIVLSSHILNEIELIADRMVIINKGKVVLEGSVDALLHQNDLNVRFEMTDSHAAMQVISESHWKRKLSNQEDQSLSFIITQAEIALLNQFFNQQGVLISGITHRRRLEELYMEITQKN
jgi:ABC-2 type transport system ATP-binding protein